MKLRIGITILMCIAGGVANGDPLRVFAASSLTGVLDDFDDEVTYSFASSALIARQIELGVDADIVIAANTAWIDYLEATGLVDGTRDLFSNRLVVVAKDHAEIDSLVNLPQGRIAVGAMEAVPAGIYAKQALQTLDVFDDLRSRLIEADNVRAALSWVTVGATPMAIVYESDARSLKGVDIIYRFPADSHDMIVYRGAVVSGSPDRAAAMDYLDTLALDRDLIAEHAFLPLQEAADLTMTGYD